MSRAIAWGLGHFADLDARDYARLLDTCGGAWGVAELTIRPDSWMENQTLAGSKLRDEGVVILGIQLPNGMYVGAPGSETPLRREDTLTVYGDSSRLAELRDHPAGANGDAVHARAVAEHLERSSASS